MKKMTLVLRGAFLFLCLQISYSQISEAAFDATLQNLHRPDAPGLTVLIAKEGKVLYRKAFGMANLELKVPMKPENVFEIGSMTKQFTAISILMLVEQGKLKLDDDITTYLPDYPTHGKKLTLHNLLNHTAGIKSYTEMEGLNTFARIDRTPTSLIDHFKNEPTDFDPGTQWHYNNSGYVILGQVIETVSGVSYAEFVTTHIFEKLGMKNSYYGSKTRLIPNRASGYMPAEKGFRNANYLSMTLPYAAGSLMSCVDDMLLWYKAIEANSLVSAESKKKAFTNTTLNNGEPTYYGYGWLTNEVNGVPSIEHGGGIFGYASQGVYLPEQDIYVVILTNRNGNSPEETAIRLAAQAVGKPFPNAENAMSLSEAQLKKWTGRYAFDKEIYRTISLKDGALYSQREGSEALKLFPVSKNKFCFEDGLGAYEFVKEKGKKTVVFSERIRKSRGVFVSNQ